VQGSDFDEDAFFEAIARVRALLIGRRALIALGIPVLTSDYDLWVHPDDIEALNRALEALDLFPSHTPEQARGRGRYVLQNDEHVDVLVARGASTKDGEFVAFDEVWARRQRLPYKGSIVVAVPAIDDLIRTKRWSMRPRDVTDIELLEGLRRSQGGNRDAG
jgi:hypothetical protein